MSENQGVGWAFWRLPFVRAFFGSPSGGFAVALAVGLLAISILAPRVFTDDEIYRRNVRARDQNPSAEFVLGTDQLGRDILKRTLYATRLSLELSISAAVIAVVIGLPFGAVVAYLPGRLRSLGLRFIEVLLAFPGILIAILIVAVLGGGSAAGAVLAIGVSFSPSLARVAYTLASSVAGREYIASARVLGLSNRRIIFRYIVPNIAETLIVVAFNAMASALVAVSSLSFLGLGVQGTEFDWGRMLTDGVEKVYLTPFAALTPAVAIATTGLAFGYMGEALARAFNPLLWTKRAGEQYTTWLRRFFAPDHLLLVGAALMLFAYYALPWFNVPSLSQAVSARDMAALLAEGAVIEDVTIVGLNWFLAAGAAGFLLGIGALLLPRLRRYLVIGGLLAGALAFAFYAVFIAQNISQLAVTQIGFFVGGIGAFGLVAQAFMKRTPEGAAWSPGPLPGPRVPDETPSQTMPAPGARPLLRVRGLTVQFPTASGVIAPVNQLSFDIAEGEIIGIVGESGSGKSMTALSIAQLVPYPGLLSADALELHGEDLLRMPPGRVQRLMGTDVAMIFQDPMSSLNPALRIGTQLTEAPRYHRHLSQKEAFELALKRMADVHIPAPEARLKQYPHEFSGGMRQRAMIAMGLMNKPSLIIADEPTTALDVTIQAQIIDVLREINREFGTAIILISHDIGVIMEICARVLVMYGGRIVEDIKTTELMTARKHPYAEALMSAVPMLDADRHKPLASIPGRPPDLDKLPPGCAFAPRCPYVQERCKASVPPLENAGDGHRMACFVRLDEIKTEQSVAYES